MKFTKTTIRLATLVGERFVEGYRIEGNEVYGLDLGVHKVEVGNGWQVTELNSGMKIREGKTRKEAVELALEIIEKRGIENVKQTIEKALENEKSRKEERARKEKIEEENKQREERKQGREAAREMIYDYVDGEGFDLIMTRSEIEELRLETLEREDLSLSYKQAFARVCEREIKRLLEEEQEIEEEQAARLEEPKQEQEQEKIDVKAIFKGITDMLSIRKLFRKYAKMVHPDQSGDDGQTFKELREEYEKALNMADGRATNTNGESIQLSKDMQRIIEKLMEIPNLEIKIRGSWLWVGGDTKPVKDKLLEIGLNWGVKAQEWYFADEVKGQKKKRGRGYSKDQLKEKYGESVIAKTKGKKPIESKVSEKKSKYKGRRK